MSLARPEPKVGMKGTRKPEYLTWDFADRIRYDDMSAGLKVDADVWQAADGWRWAAVVTPYVIGIKGVGELSEGDPPLILGREVRSGTLTAENDAGAKSAAEGWIAYRVANLPRSMHEATILSEHM